jgi:hypothetical protein
MGALSFSILSKSKKWSNMTNISSKLGQGPTRLQKERNPFIYFKMPTFKSIHRENHKHNTATQ